MLRAYSFYHLLGVLLLMLITPACGSNKDAQNAGRATRWAQIPILIKADNFIPVNPATAEADFIAAVDYWNQALQNLRPGQTLLQYQGVFQVAIPTSSLTDPNAVVPDTGILHPNSWPFASNTLGKTVRSTDSDNFITGALIAINLSTYNFCYGICGHSSDISYRHVIAHELGHLIGMVDHSPDPTNIMYDGNYHDGDLSHFNVDSAVLNSLLP